MGTYQVQTSYNFEELSILELIAGKLILWTCSLYPYVERRSSSIIARIASIIHSLTDVREQPVRSVFPTVKSIEQCRSEVASLFHACTKQA